MPKVSVCIPSYKQTQYLDLCLRSVFEQGFLDYEVIITDDTPDNTVQNFLQAHFTDRQIRYFRNARSLGTPGNWNEAISKATGEYIKLLHHDDFFTRKDSLGKYVALLDENPDASFGFSATAVWNIPTNRKWVHWCTSKQLTRIEQDPFFLLFRNMIGAPSATIYRRTDLQYDQQLKWLVDIDFYIRMLRSNPHLAMSREALVCTSDNTPGQVTQEVAGDRELQLREHLFVLSKLGSPETKNFIAYFDRLFTRFQINSLAELAQVTPIPEQTKPFLAKVFVQLKKNRPIKKLIDRFYGSRLNNSIFKAEQF